MGRPHSMRNTCLLLLLASSASLQRALAFKARDGGLNFETLESSGPGPGPLLPAVVAAKVATDGAMVLGGAAAVAAGTAKLGQAIGNATDGAVAGFQYPIDKVQTPTKALLSYFAQLLEEQADDGKAHRSIVLDAMHSHLTAPEEAKAFLEMEGERTKKFGSESVNIVDGKSIFSMGPNTPMIPYEMFRSHRQRFTESFKAALAGQDLKVDWVFFEGGKLEIVWDSDIERQFRQEPYFKWLWGVDLHDVNAAIDLNTGKTYLFVPRLNEQKKVWISRGQSFDWYKKKFEVDEVQFVEDTLKVLQKADSQNGNPVVVYDDQHTHDHVPGGSHALQKYEEQLNVKKSPLITEVLKKLRSVKDPWEIQIMQYVNDVSSEAMVATMYQSATATALRNGPASMEYGPEGLFRYVCWMRGCTRQLYQASCPAGRDVGLIHFGAEEVEPQSELVRQDQLRLQDMGAAYAGYTADVALMYPAGGKFSKEQLEIYNTVLEAAMSAEAMAGPYSAENPKLHASSFSALTAIADKVLLRGLLKVKILKGSIEELLNHDLVRYFQPHAIGHHLGLDAHDPGDHDKFEPGNIITIEPAIYFSAKAEELLSPKHVLAKYVNQDMLKHYFPVGGARVEDDLLITKDGNRVMTRLPRRSADIEKIMAGGPFDVQKQPILEWPNPSMDILAYIQSDAPLDGSGAPASVPVESKGFFGALAGAWQGFWQGVINIALWIKG